ncbi:hypothetical protein HDV62DRAFT_148522 [Trichoderma sp. SZMC 28011]
MFRKISSTNCTTELVTLHAYEYSYMHPIHDACPCFLDDRDIEWTHAVLRTCSLSTSTSQPSISGVIFSSLAATSSQIRLFCPSHPLPHNRTLNIQASASAAPIVATYMDVMYSIVLRLHTEEDVACQPGSSGQGSGSTQQDFQGCICTSTLCYERLQRRVCRMISPVSRVPNTTGSRFVVSEPVS